MGTSPNLCYIPSPDLPTNSAGGNREEQQDRTSNIIQFEFGRNPHGSKGFSRLALRIETGFRIRTLQPLGYTSTEHRPVPVCRPDERSRRPTEGPLFQIHAKRSGRKIRLLKIPKKQREIKRGGERNKNCSFSASVGLTRCGKIRYAKTTEQTRNEGQEGLRMEMQDMLADRLKQKRALSHASLEEYSKELGIS